MEVFNRKRSSCVHEGELRSNYFVLRWQRKEQEEGKQFDFFCVSPLSFLIFTLVDFSPFRTKQFSREITCELCWYPFDRSHQHSGDRENVQVSFFPHRPKTVSFFFSSRTSRRMTPTIAADVEKCCSVGALVCW